MSAGKPNLGVMHEASFELSFQHTSMQFSDSRDKMAHDVDIIMSRRKHILTGTEAGGDILPGLLLAGAEEHGYRINIQEGRDSWVAVREDLVDGHWDKGYIPVISHEEGEGVHGNRGIVWVAFSNDQLGHITVGAGHYLTNGRRAGEPNYQLNLRYAKAIGVWGKEAGAGGDLVFYAGDQNVVDRTDDTFFGHPFTSVWDELGKHQDTGHGNIDVIASYDRDGRVSATSVRALDDKDVFLNTDHFMVAATFDVKLLKKHR